MISRLGSFVLALMVMLCGCGGNPEQDETGRCVTLPLGVSTVQLGEYSCLLVADLEEGWVLAQWVGASGFSASPVRLSLRCISYRRKAVLASMGSESRGASLVLIDPRDNREGVAIEWSAYGFTRALAELAHRSLPSGPDADVSRLASLLREIVAMVQDDYDVPKYLGLDEFGLCVDTVGGPSALSIVMHSYDDIASHAGRAFNEGSHGEAVREYRAALEGFLGVYEHYESEAESR